MHRNAPTAQADVSVGFTELVVAVDVEDDETGALVCVTKDETDELVEDGEIHCAAPLMFWHSVSAARCWNTHPLFTNQLNLFKPLQTFASSAQVLLLVG